LLEGERLMTENDKKNDDSLDDLETRMANARIALNQAWEEYGETNEKVLAAAVDFDRLLNEYMRIREKKKANDRQ